MTMFTEPEPLNDAELDRLEDFLKSCKGGKAMNIEQLDGFFAALIAGPETVMPSEYSPEVFGGEMSDVCEFSSPEEADEIFGLMIRHWNTIAGALFNREVYVPLLLEDENGVAHGNDWARGFVRGMHMPCGQKTRPGRCLEIIAQRTLMKSRPRGLLPVEIPSILNICCEPIAHCPVDFYAASLS